MEHSEYNEIQAFSDVAGESGGTMHYKIEFQYKPVGQARPYDAVQDEEYVFDDGEAFPIPNVGDSVSYLEGGNTVARKVLTRHFSYLGQWCVVNIVATDIADKEMSSRLKE